MKANDEMKQIAVNVISNFSKEQIENIKENYKKEGLNKTRLIFDLYYGTGLNSAIFDRFGYNHELNDEHLGTLTKWAIKEVHNISL